MVNSTKRNLFVIIAIIVLLFIILIERLNSYSFSETNEKFTKNIQKNESFLDFFKILAWLVEFETLAGKKKLELIVYKGSKINVFILLVLIIVTYILSPKKIEVVFLCGYLGFI